MTWTKREAVTNLAILGDEEGHRKKVGGLLIGMPRDRGYPDKVNYELVQADGEVLVLSGSASLSRQINEEDIGRFVKCEFTGWGRSGNGKFKMIDVNVWEGEPDARMKAWPQYAEMQAKRANGKNGHAKAAAPKASAPADEFEDFPQGGPSEEENDLPFD